MSEIEIACRPNRTTIFPMARERACGVISYDDATERYPNAPHVAIVPIDIWEEILAKVTK